MNETFKKVLDWLGRNGAWVGIGVVLLFLIGWEITVLRTLIMIGVYEAAALGLSGLALWAYTQLHFTQVITYGVDKKANSVEIHGFQTVIAAVFIAVHVLVGLVVAGSMFLQVEKTTIKDDDGVVDSIQVVQDSTFYME